MKCEGCPHHLRVGPTHFCKSEKHKHKKYKAVRIADEDAKRDIDCAWAKEEKDGI